MDSASLRRNRSYTQTSPARVLNDRYFLLSVLFSWQVAVARVTTLCAVSPLFCCVSVCDVLMPAFDALIFIRKQMKIWARGPTRQTRLATRITTFPRRIDLYFSGDKARQAIWTVISFAGGFYAGNTVSMASEAPLCCYSDCLDFASSLSKGKSRPRLKVAMMSSCGTMFAIGFCCSPSLLTHGSL